MKIYLFSAFLFFSVSIQAQSVVVSADKMNVFYLCVDNVIEVAVEGIANENLKISIDNGEIIAQKKGKYIVHPEKTGTGNIIVEWNEHRILKPFRVKPIPDPIILLGSNRLEGHTASIQEALDSFTGLIAYLDTFDFDAKCSTVNYTCTLIHANGDVKQLQVNGYVSDEVRALLRQPKQGDKIIFSNIQAKCPCDKFPRKIDYEITRVVK